MIDARARYRAAARRLRNTVVYDQILASTKYIFTKPLLYVHLTRALF